MKKTIILTYDYELFFGDHSGTVSKTLIEPTNLLLEQFEKSNLKATFFVDYLMIKYLGLNTDERSRSDLHLIQEQLKDIIRRGHRIELHIHPHWVDAKYNGDGTWNYCNFSHYSLNSFTEEEIIKMFVEGCEILHLLARSVEPDYKIVAFRAGGWAVQPFSLLKKAFLSADIRIDSSVSYGIKNTNKDSYYDFTTIPRKSFYKFTDSIEEEETEGLFTEVPITSYYRFIFYKLADRIFRRFSSKMVVLADGTHFRKADQIKSGWHFFNKAMLNTTCVSVMTAVLSALLSWKRLLVFIDHPKDFTMATLDSLRIISRFADSTTYKDLLQK